MCADDGQRATREHIELLLRVARMYYLDHAGQAEIARAVGYSRPTVSRLLQEARDRRMVTVTVSHPIEQVIDAERQLSRRFGLDIAIVAGRPRGETSAKSVGAAAAHAVAEHGTPRTMIALSNGTSLAAVVSAMPRQRWPFSCVTQMIGSIASPGLELADSPDLCRGLADRLGGTYRPLPVPIVLGSAQVAAQVRHEEIVLTTFELAARSDIALLGVGAVGPRGTSGLIIQQFVTPEVQAEIRRLGAVAHICGHHFDAKGRHLPTSMCDRTIAMPPERLADIKHSIVVAWGSEKVAALSSVLRSGLVNGLATDEETAQLLLTYEP